MPPLRPQPTVVLDPGHGGIDPGAISPHGIYEKDIVRPIVWGFCPPVGGDSPLSCRADPQAATNSFHYVTGSLAPARGMPSVRQTGNFSVALARAIVDYSRAKSSCSIIRGARPILSF